MENIEVRYLEIRANEDSKSRTIEGSAIRFNSLSEDLGGFVEEILPEAVSTEFLASQDIVMLFNHSDKAGVLARSKKGNGTLKYTIDTEGVNFQFEARDTALGNEVLGAVKAGDITQCSFAFRVADGGDIWTNLGDGMYKRSISKFEIIKDFSVVLYPAYSETNINSRGLEQLKFNELEAFKLVEAEELRAIEETKKADELKAVEDLKEYYLKYDTILNKYSTNN